MSIDKFFDKRYNPDSYNCVDFCAEVWKHLTGEDRTALIASLQGPIEGRTLDRSILAGIVRLAKPVSPCIAIMQRPKAAPHVGIYFKDRILHITERRVEFQPPEIAAMAFQTVGYYQCK